MIAASEKKEKRRRPKNVKAAMEYDAAEEKKRQKQSDH